MEVKKSRDGSSAGQRMRKPSGIIQSLKARKLCVVGRGGPSVSLGVQRPAANSAHVQGQVNISAQEEKATDLSFLCLLCPIQSLRRLDVTHPHW